MSDSQMKLLVSRLSHLFADSEMGTSHSRPGFDFSLFSSFFFFFLLLLAAAAFRRDRKRRCDRMAQGPDCAVYIWQK